MLLLRSIPTFTFPASRKPQNRRLCKMTLDNVLLIDMDNTLVDWDLEFARRWVSSGGGPDIDIIKRRKHFELEQNFPSSQQPLATSIMGTPGFYAALQPQPGAVEAVREMVDAGLEVLFCTAPTPFQYETCVAEKFAWVRQWLGEEFLRRIVITRDKTVVRGTVLVDDKPRISGLCEKPEWVHVVFEQPYNVDVADAPRLTQWKDWRGVLKEYFPVLRD